MNILSSKNFTHKIERVTNDNINKLEIGELVS